jgi:hypothetical protein
VFLLLEKEQTIGIAKNSYEAAQYNRGSPLYLETLGLSPVEKIRIERQYTEQKDGNSIEGLYLCFR